MEDSKELRPAFGTDPRGSAEAWLAEHNSIPIEETLTALNTHADKCFPGMLLPDDIRFISEALKGINRRAHTEEEYTFLQSN